MTGMSVLSTDDQILVGTDTFSLRSFMIQATSIPSDPDSFLLGSADSKLGSIKADIITQLSCPEGFVFPEKVTLDSAVLTLFYDNWYGDGNTPMSVNVYHLDRKTLNYDSVYNTDIAPTDYCSLSESAYAMMKECVFTANNPPLKLYSSALSDSMAVVKLHLTDEVMNSLFNDGSYVSQEQFNEAFKGLYITSEFGSATVLYISEISVSLFYTKTYSLEGKDTTISDVIDFYANDEVRTVNRIEYYNESDFYDFLLQDSTISYVASPAHLYTVYDIPLSDVVADVRDSLLSGKRSYVNSAKIKVYATNYSASVDLSDVNQWASPPAYMMLIDENSVEDFFLSRSLPNDTSAILSSLATETDSLDRVRAYYSYDLSELLTKALRTGEVVDTLSMILVPVSVNEFVSSTSGATSITSVRPLQTISSTVVNTQYNKEFPLRLSVVATGL